MEFETLGKYRIPAIMIVYNNNAWGVWTSGAGRGAVRAQHMYLFQENLRYEKIAEALDEDFDIEIVEMHHNKKIDAPSGTALMLGDAVANAKRQTLDSLKDGKILDVSLDGVPDPDDYKNLFTINEFMTPFAPVDPVTMQKNPFRAIINMPSSALHVSCLLYTSPSPRDS